MADEIVEWAVQIVSFLEETTQRDFAVIAETRIVLFKRCGVLEGGVNHGVFHSRAFEQFGFHTVLQNIHNWNVKFFFECF